MKIRHDITREGKTLKGQILETIFEDGEERGDLKYHYLKDEEFYICSSNCPELYPNSLFVWGYNKKYDNDIVKYKYESEEEAQKILDYINEFAVEEEIKLSEPVEMESTKEFFKGCNILINNKESVGINLNEPQSPKVIRDAEKTHEDFMQEINRIKEEGFEMSATKLNKLTKKLKEV